MPHASIESPAVPSPGTPRTGDAADASAPPLRVPWTLVLGFWALFWVFSTAIRLGFTYWVAPAGRYPSPVYGALNDGLQLGQWALLTPAVFWLTGRLPITRGNWRRRLPVHALIGIALVLATSLGMMAGHYLVLPSAQRHPWTLLVVSEMLLSYGTPLFLLLYAGLVGTGTALHVYAGLQRQQLASARMAAQLAEARLQALRMQLHPHFLYNTLNTISTLTQHDPASARRVIARLGELLRWTLESAHEREAELDGELRFVERYLEIAAARFGPRLRVDVRVQPDARAALVPTLVLQPLVENAVEHGIARDPDGGRIRIEAAVEDDVLRIRVRNSGRGVRPGHGEGVGLRNTRDRLRQMYGGAAGFRLWESAADEVTAELWLPFHTAADLHVPLVSAGTAGGAA